MSWVGRVVVLVSVFAPAETCDSTADELIVVQQAVSVFAGQGTQSSLFVEGNCLL
jgi:hypothetical protein